MFVQDIDVEKLESYVLLDILTTHIVFGEYHHSTEEHRREQELFSAIEKELARRQQVSLAHGGDCERMIT
jgi:uncharacterized iron-regulated protein